MPPNTLIEHHGGDYAVLGIPDSATAPVEIAG